jgi:hypothetical protein
MEQQFDPQQKDASIAELVESLAQSVGEIELQAVDHWQSDPYAIGVQRPEHPGRLVYVSTYYQRPGRYFYAAEEPTAGGRSHEVVGGRYTIGYEELVDVIRRHLAG